MDITPSNVGDLVFWTLAAVFFFYLMGFGMRGSEGSWTFGPPKRRVPIVAQSAFAVAPLFFSHYEPVYRNSPFWDPLCVASMGVIARPLVFPTLSFEHGNEPPEAKAGRWLGTRIDLIIKKWSAAALVGFIAHLFPSFPAFFHRHIPIPHYFLPHGETWDWPFGMPFLAIATFSLVLRAMVLVASSRFLASLVLFCGLVMVGYAIELGGVMNRSGIPFSATLIATVVWDFLVFLLATA